MKKCLFLFLFVMGGLGLFAQTISHSVIAAGGGDYTDENSGLSISWTIGEPVIGTLVSEDETIILTQGFQQGSLGGEVIVVPLVFSPEITVYPNPTSNFVNIRIENAQREFLTLKIIDLYGRVKAVHKRIDPEQIVSINTANFVSGVYWLQFYNGNKLLKTIQLVKQ